MKLKILIITLINIMLLCFTACGQDFKKIRKWQNKGIDLGNPGVNVSYNCRVVNSPDHGLSVGYLTRSGFEIGISTIEETERLERLISDSYLEIYARYRAFNLWKNAYLNLQLTYRDSKYLPDSSGDRIQSFTCSSGISQIFSPKQLRLELYGMVTEQSGKIGYTLGIGRKF